MSGTWTRYLIPGEVASILRMPPSRVSRLARGGVIPHFVLPDGELLFDEEEVRAWLQRNRGPRDQRKGL
jgi:hypothetical protein